MSSTEREALPDYFSPFRDIHNLSLLSFHTLVDHAVLNYRTDIPDIFTPSKRVTLVSTLWRRAAGVNTQELKDTGAYKAFSIFRTLISCYDDYLDDSSHTEIIYLSDVGRASLKDKDESFNNIVSDLVRTIMQSLHPDKKNRVCSQLNILEKNN